MSKGAVARIGRLGDSKNKRSAPNYKKLCVLPQSFFTLYIIENVYSRLGENIDFDNISHDNTFALTKEDAKVLIDYLQKWIN